MKKERFILQDREISSEVPPFIIMEAGINHEGSLKKAMQLVDAAKQNGADCIKFQCHITDEEMIPSKMKPGKISKESLWNIIKRCELSFEEELKVQKYCAEKQIQYLCTPFSRAAADRLYDMNVSAFKIGSGECNNLPLISHIAKMRKPIILSTGMNNLKTVGASVKTIRNFTCPLLLMHCTSMYPTPYKFVKLGAIQDLQKRFDLEVGFSDHSLGIYSCLGAVALGAVAVEKHFTVSSNWPGPDIPVSITPNQLHELVKGVQAIWESRGGRKEILKEEKPVAKFAYASVVTINPIKKGEKFSYKNIWVKRPGVGEILARDFYKVLNRTAKRNLPKNAFVKRHDIT